MLLKRLLRNLKYMFPGELHLVDPFAIKQALQGSRVENRLDKNANTQSKLEFSMTIGSKPQLASTITITEYKNLDKKLETIPDEDVDLENNLNQKLKPDIKSNESVKEPEKNVILKKTEPMKQVPAKKTK